jgi:uncharacterized membrane protein YgcG
VLILLALVASPIAAQNYYFGVPELDLQVYVQTDGSARLVYDITFQNQPSGDTIDIVDIGLPSEDYRISTMSASVDGSAIGDIRPSEYVHPGIEVHLGSQSIRPGDTGTLHFEATVPDLAYQDVTNRDLASLQITPTWFDSSFVDGTTNLQIAIHLPEGVTPDEALYQDEPFTNKAIFQDRTVVLWQFPQERVTGPHLVGVSFPQRVMTNVVPMSVFTLAMMWFENNTTLRLILGAIALLLFSILYLRFTGGTGVFLWLILGAGLVWMFAQSAASQLLVFLPLVPLVVLNEKNLRSRKRPYLPPIAQVEGGGIKRGLTAPEAAALLEMPINKVLTLIIFGLLKKGVLRQVQESPLVVELDPAFDVAKSGVSPKQRVKHRKEAAQAKGVPLRSYEHPFLDAIEAKPGKPVHEIDFGDAMRRFLLSLAGRVKGFDLSDTQEYYRTIVKRALEQASAIEEIPARQEAIDRDLEWILIDDRYPTVLDTPTYHYSPIWIRPATGGASSSGGLSLPSGKGASGSSPGLSSVAAGFAGWTQNTMNDMASAILPGSLNVPGTSGVVNLSGFDRTVGNVFEAMAKSSGSGGGRSSGGGCACACAGCACACACAGGGR